MSTRNTASLLGALALLCGCVPSTITHPGDQLTPVSRLTLPESGLRFGYIDPTGSLVIPCEFIEGQPFSEGLAQVRLRDRRLAYIRADGQVAFTLREDVVYAGLFSEGLAVVNVGGTPGEIDDHNVYDGKWGYIDRRGRFAIEPRALPFTEYDARIGEYMHFKSHFADGRALTPVDGGWGFIDREGKLIIAGPYEQAQPFHRGVAQVSLRLWERRLSPNTTESGSQHLVIDPTGRVLWADPPANHVPPPDGAEVFAQPVKP